MEMYLSIIHIIVCFLFRLLMVLLFLAVLVVSFLFSDDLGLSIVDAHAVLLAPSAAAESSCAPAGSRGPPLRSLHLRLAEEKPNDLLFMSASPFVSSQPL
jgi:hypothetical protein